jgi:cell division protease FtsH
MVAQFGMSEAIGPLNYGEDESQPFLGYSMSHSRSYSEETAAKIDVEVRRLVEEAYEDTLKLLRDNRDKLEALAQELLTNEIVERKRLEAIVGKKIEPEGTGEGTLVGVDGGSD